MFDRLPTRIRTATLAGLAALMVFGGGAWWLQRHVYENRYADTMDKARVQARAVARNMIINQRASGLFADQSTWPFLVLTPKGTIGTHGNGAGGYQGLVEQLPPAPADARPEWTDTRTVRVGAAEPVPHGEAPPTVSLAHRTLTAVAASIDVVRGEPTIFGTNGGRYTVYVFVLPDAAQAAADELAPALRAGVPLAALVVAATAYLSTRRALRPVEAIRRELAEIGERHLDRRVPVPRARDEISRMAVTTNETLDRLERAAEQQQRFVADASHELRSPITALRSQLEISLAHPEKTDWPEAARDALTATRRLQALADDLLFLTRPDTEPHQAALVDLAGLARELADETRAVQPDAPAIHVRAPATAPVRGHALHLTRLLRNLLDNALRHAHTSVTVSVERVGDTWRAQVHNDGPDIDPADRERIFERFTRLDESRSRHAGGSGLGLAIARDIAVRHGGTLHVAPEPPGGGATFVVELPLGPS